MNEDREELKRKVNYLLNADIIDEIEVLRVLGKYKSDSALNAYLKETSNIETPQEFRVVRAFETTVDKIESRSRKTNITFARLIMFLYYKTLGFDNTDIGIKYGGRDRTTVRSGLIRLKSLYDINDSLLMNYLNRDKTILTDKMVEFIKR